MVIQMDTVFQMDRASPMRQFKYESDTRMRSASVLVWFRYRVGDTAAGVGGHPLSLMERVRYSGRAAAVSRPTAAADPITTRRRRPHHHHYRRQPHHGPHTPLRPLPPPPPNRGGGGCGGCYCSSGRGGHVQAAPPSTPVVPAGRPAPAPATGNGSRPSAGGRGSGGAPLGGSCQPVAGGMAASAAAAKAAEWVCLTNDRAGAAGRRSRGSRRRVGKGPYSPIGDESGRCGRRTHAPGASAPGRRPAGRAPSGVRSQPPAPGWKLTDRSAGGNNSSSRSGHVPPPPSPPPPPTPRSPATPLPPWPPPRACPSSSQWRWPQPLG